MKSKWFKTAVSIQILFLLSIAKADPTFSLTYSGAETSGKQAVQAPDGYYLSCIDFQQDYFGVMWLIRVDTSGNLIWSRPFFESNTGNRDFESGGYILSTPDGGCLIAGYSEPRATGVNTDVALVKVDSTGTIVWEEIYGNNDDSVYSLTGIAGSGNGSLLAFSHPYSESFFVMYDHDGNRLWQTETLEEYNYIEAVTAESNNGFIATGRNDYGEGWIIKIDETGLMEYTPLSENAEIIYASAIVPANNDGYAICGRTDGSDAFLSRMDAGGNELWSYTSGFEGRDRATSIEHTTSGLFAFTGYESMEDGSNTWFALLDDTGKLLWKRDFPSDDYAIFESVKETTDGGFVLGGTTSHNESSAAWLLRTDESGYIQNSDTTYLTLTENVTAIREPIGWIVCCEVISDSTTAMTRANELQQILNRETGTLWIPDWPSLSGYEGWLVYTGPFYTPEDPELSHISEQIKELYPVAYLVFAGSEFEGNIHSL